jgi:hypothetical protein
LLVLAAILVIMYVSTFMTDAILYLTATFPLISGYWCWTIFHFILGVSFVGGGNQSTWRKSPTCRMLLTNVFVYLSVLLRRRISLMISMINFKCNCYQINIKKKNRIKICSNLLTKKRRNSNYIHVDGFWYLVTGNSYAL